MWRSYWQPVGRGVGKCMGKGSVLACGKGCEERNGGGVGKCAGCGAPTHFPTSPPSPHLFLHLPLPPSHPYTFLHLPLIPLPTSPFPRSTSQHIFLLSPHLPSPSQSVAKLPCDEVTVAKLLWRSYHVAKFLATPTKP